MGPWGSFKMIHVIATIELVPGKKREFLEEFHRLVPLVRGEAGCVEYGPTADVAAELPRQIPVRENVVTILEKWEDLAALRAHLVAPHMGPYREKVKGLVSSVSLQVLSPT